VVRRPSKRAIIDAIIDQATNGLFKGDKRDGDTPPITLRNFHDEMFRLGARALRARLSRLSRSELKSEFEDGRAYLDALWAVAAQASHQRQAELGSKHGLQSAILAAARYHRNDLKGTPKEAWRLIKRNPFSAGNGETVLIDGVRNEEKMFVQSRDGTRKKAGIKYTSWQKRYWPRAKASISAQPS
jgi:hypothetical protein